MHAGREAPCTAFGEDSVKLSAGELRNTGGTAACQHPVRLKAPVKLIVSSAPTTMKSGRVAERSWSHRFGRESYIAIAARTLPLCGTAAFTLPEMLGEAGLVMM